MVCSPTPLWWPEWTFALYKNFLGRKTISMTVRYSRLAPKHTYAAVERLVVVAGRLTDTNADGLEQVPVEALMLQQVTQ